MDIYVIEDDIIRNIQQAFCRQYPYLKLQFYKNPHAEGEPSPKQELLDTTLPVEEVTMFHTAGKIDINPERTVGQVEYDFFHFLGLCVQVMRQSGHLWLETTGTDSWTLKQQNDKGYADSLPIDRDIPPDFDLMDTA